MGTGSYPGVNRLKYSAEHPPPDCEQVGSYTSASPLRLFRYCRGVTFTFKPCVSYIFMANDHTRHSGLVRGEHAEK